MRSKGVKGYRVKELSSEGEKRDEVGEEVKGMIGGVPKDKNISLIFRYRSIDFTEDPNLFNRKLECIKHLDTFQGPFGLRKDLNKLLGKTEGCQRDQYVERYVSPSFSLHPALPSSLQPFHLFTSPWHPIYPYLDSLTLKSMNSCRKVRR